jgi:ABC-type multidrug transport system ATPase subunit
MGPLGIGRDDLEKRVDALSEGAAQKLSLARALLRRTPALLLDEPARNLDVKSAAGFSALIKDLAAKDGLAVLYAAHSPEELARVCGRVLMMENGKVKGYRG